MTALAEMMLETARLLGTVHEGEADSGTTTTLVDDALEYPAGHFAGGTLWLLTGAGTGNSYVVSKFSENTITIGTTLAAVVASGNRYAVANNRYARHILKQAVNFALRQIVIPNLDTSMNADSNGTLTLDSGIYNVKSVLVGDAGSEKPNYYWDERGGVLYFDQGRAPDSSERLSIWYAIPHGELTSDTGLVNDQIDREWLAWAAAVYCMRNRLQLVKRDDPALIDMLNEAKVMEMQMRQKMKTQINLPRDPRLGSW